jgi:hypothetical protein
MIFSKCLLPTLLLVSTSSFANSVLKKKCMDKAEKAVMAIAALEMTSGPYGSAITTSQEINPPYDLKMSFWIFSNDGQERQYYYVDTEDFGGANCRILKVETKESYRLGGRWRWE